MKREPSLLRIWISQGLSLLSFLGLGFAGEHAVPSWGKISIFAFGVTSIFIVWLFIPRPEKEEELEEGSERFVEFFSRWYSEKGTVEVFCTDLERRVSFLKQSVYFDPVDIF